MSPSRFCVALAVAVAPGACASPRAPYAPAVIAPPPPLPSGSSMPPPLPADGDYLADDVAKRFPKRCIVARKGPLRFMLDGPVVTHAVEPLSHPFEAIVVEEHARALRFVVA